MSTRFLRSELRLIYGRRRNIAGMAVLAVVPIIIAFAVKYSGSPRGGGGGGGGEGGFIGQATNNGLFVGLAALTVELPLFLPLAVAVVAGDAVAGEANVGTLRYLLARPVQRTRLLAVKYLGVLIASQCDGRSPSTARSAEPMASATRTCIRRRAAATRACTSARIDRKLPKLTYTTGMSDGVHSQAAMSSGRTSSRTADPRKACGGSSAVRAGSCNAWG
jgi:hypothetical protein